MAGAHERVSSVKKSQPRPQSRPQSQSYSEIWSPAELKILGRLDSPVAIQRFLDSLRYSSESRYRSPRTVLADRIAHCYDGAVFAAMALRRIGYPPLIIDMDGVRDDDHVVAIFKKNGRFGAIAKSNFAGLRYREPVYASLRELVMSYFESYYNVARDKGTARSCTGRRPTACPRGRRA